MLRLLKPNTNLSMIHPWSMVQLKNGYKIPKIALITTMINIRLLFQKYPVVLYELVEKCRNPRHDMYGDTEKIAERFGLIFSGSIHETTKNIVLSAIQGKGLAMALVNPIHHPTRIAIIVAQLNNIAKVNEKLAKVSFAVILGLVAYGIYDLYHENHIGTAVTSAKKRLFTLWKNPPESNTDNNTDIEQYRSSSSALNR